MYTLTLMFILSNVLKYEDNLINYIQGQYLVHNN